MEFLGLDSRDFVGDVRKEVKGNKLRLYLSGPDAFARLGEVSF